MAVEPVAGVSCNVGDTRPTAELYCLLVGNKLCRSVTEAGVCVCVSGLPRPLLDSAVGES